MRNRVVPTVRVSHVAPTKSQLSSSSSLPPYHHLLRKRVLNPNDGTDINPLIELLRLNIAGYIHAHNTAALVAALNTGARAELGVEGRLTVRTGGRGDVEGVAACCCGTDAAEAGDVPGPGRGAGGWGCGSGAEEGEDGDLGKHVGYLRRFGGWR
jgi:hypothetical protein